MVKDRFWYLTGHDQSALFPNRIQSVILLIHIVKDCRKQHSGDEIGNLAYHRVIVDRCPDNNYIRFMVLIDSVARLIPGVLAGEESAMDVKLMHNGPYDKFNNFPD